ncbi:MAG: ABC transporter permease subunit [Clostridiales bacterium]|nr:ABC transporter permease subunit [Clostridiales bacterium]
MIKFMNLVKNEYIKIFRRVSTWILIILVALAAIGFNSMLKIGQVYSERSSDSYYSDPKNAIQDMKNEINYLKQEKADGYEIDIERCNFMIDHKISYRDWRYDDISTLFEKKKSLFLAKSAGEITDQYSDEEKQIQNQLDMLSNNNWKAYYTLKVNTVKSDTMLSAEEKEAHAYAYRFMLDNDISPESNNWQVSLANIIMQRKIELISMGADQELSDEQLQAKQDLKDDILIDEYRLKNDIASAPENTGLNNLNEINFWSVLGLSTLMINVISLAIIIIAGASIANEFSSGTIKFLLINPVKRSKIFLSKYVMILTLSVFLILGFYVVNVLCAGILFGFDSITSPYLYAVDGAIHQMPGLSFVLWKYLLGSVNLIVMGTLAFAISSLLRNAALAIGVSVFALLGGNIIMSILGGMLKFDWARFLIFANVDLNAIIEGNTMFQGMTVGFSLAVIAVHMVVFFLTAWDGFMHRESI